MKFHFNTEIIIGTLLIAWGASILIKLIWGIDVPIIKPLLGIFLIYWGLSFLLGPRFYHTYTKRTYSYKIDDEE